MVDVTDEAANYPADLPRLSGDWIAHIKAEAYRKGVEDAARVCENECDEVRFEDRNAIARNIRKLAPTPPARPE